MNRNLRLIVAVITSLLDEAILVALLLWGLPRLGVNIPLPATVIVIVAFAVWAVTVFHLGTRALRREPVTGLASMIGTVGEAVTPLKPTGYVKIKGELWDARAEKENITAGSSIIVTGQKGLKLTVRINENPDAE